MGVTRLAALAALAFVASCTGFEPAGRSASREAPPPVAAQPAAAPAVAPAPAAAPVTPPPGAVTVPGVAVTPPPPRRGDDNDIVVPGVQQRQVQPPHGDPRTESERMADIRAWDRCITHVQDAGARDPTRPSLDDPEDYCRRSLGMANRLAVPLNRQP
ncbi:MAG: hypothetical protein ABUL42_01575 [Terricaulis silvestris]